MKDPKIGDIVRWEAVGVPTRDMRVVDIFPNEPKHIMVTDVDDFQSQPRCFFALAVDVVKVRDGEPPARVRKPNVVVSPDIWKVPDGCVLAEEGV
jgi:hypothetical protein